MIKNIAGVLLIIIAGVMIYIGVVKEMPPPALTGLGFIAIGVVFLTGSDRRKN